MPSSWLRSPISFLQWCNWGQELKHTLIGHPAQYCCLNNFYVTRLVLHVLVPLLSISQSGRTCVVGTPPRHAPVSTVIARPLRSR